MQERVSIFANVADVQGKEVSLSTVLNAIKNGKWKDKITKLRSIKDEKEQKAYKNTLPCFTGSGVFSSRKSEGLTTHSNIMILDFDLKDNPILLEQFNEIRQKLIAAKHIAFLFLSCRGNGFAVGIKIEGERHTESFRYLEKYYREKHGLTIDKGCKDVTRLRFISYDPDLHFNEGAETIIIPHNFSDKAKHSETVFNANGKSHEIMERIIASGKLPGDDTYESWVKVGFALVTEFGETGRDYFHKLSRMSPKYDLVDCDRKFDNCLKTNKGEVSFATIVHMAKGIYPPANTVSSKNKTTMSFTRLGDLFLEPEESASWLVDGLLPSGGFSILVSKPKVGKSTLARTLMLCVSRGEVFLGRDTIEGAVVYLCLEEKRAEVKRHFRDMGATGDEEIHIYAGGAPVDAIKQIQTATERLKPALLVIDPLFRLAKVKDGNDYVQVTNALDPLLRLARDTGTHVLCVHHSPKGERDIEDCILGSQAIFGTVDTLLVMKRHEHYRTLQTRQRYGEDLEETILNFDRETKTVTTGGTRQEQDVSIVEKAIIDFLSTQNEPTTETTINRNVEGAIKSKCKSLRKLVAENKVNREGQGTRGNPFKYSTILLPSICVEVEKENPKMTANPHGCKDYSTISDFDNFPKDGKLQIVEFSPKNDSQKSIVEEIPEVEFIEEIENNV